MNALRIIVWFFICFLLVCCRKSRYPETVVTNQPVFYFSAKIDNQPVSRRAGINNYYIYTACEPDSNNVYALSGEMKQIGCTACVGAFRIQINDHKVSDQNAPVLIDSALQLKKYPYLMNKSSAQYEVRFKSAYNKNPSSFFWDFGDGSFSHVAHPVHIYKKEGTYPVCLTITGNNSCSNSICNMEIINGKNIRTMISSVPNGTPATNMSFTQNTSGKAPFSYFWSFGDGSTSTAPDPFHNYSIPGSYRVKLKVVDANKDSCIASFNAVTKNDGSSCTANYSIANITPKKNLGLSEAILSWTDESGTVFSSAAGSQDGDSYFEIMSVEDYKPNEKGEKAKKIRIRFKCKIYNGSKSLSVDEGEAVIVVSYK